MLSLHDLVRECGNLGCIAGEILREVHEIRLHGGSLGVVDKGQGTGQAFDPQTVADRRAEEAIVLGLRRRFGKDLCIVGEESGIIETRHQQPQSTDETKRRLVELDWWQGDDDDDVMLDLPKVSVFIDPLDATREYTDARVEYCTVLIGICFNKEPIAGVIVEPFAHNGNITSCWWGAKTKGCFETQLAHNDKPQQSRKVELPRCNQDTVRLVVSRSRAGGVVEQFVKRYVDLLDNVQHRSHSIAFAGGCGYKILEVLKGEADLYPFPCPGTSMWDSCAGAALLQCAGGALLGMNGKPLVFDAVEGSAKGFKVDGLMAGCDLETVQFATQAVASSIHLFRTLQFDIITNAYLSANFASKEQPVVAFETPQASVIVVPGLEREFIQLDVILHLLDKVKRALTYVRSGAAQHVWFFTKILPQLKHHHAYAANAPLLLHQENDGNKAVICFFDKASRSNRRQHAYTLDEQIRFLNSIHAIKTTTTMHGNEEIVGFMRGPWLRDPISLDDYFGGAAAIVRGGGDNCRFEDFAYLYAMHTNNMQQEVLRVLRAQAHNWDENLFQRALKQQHHNRIVNEAMRLVSSI